MDFFSQNYGFGKFKPEAIRLLKKTIDVLDEFNINHLLISGTLLGFIRHNDFIPWDDDIDLLVDSSILKRLGDIANRHPDLSVFYKTKYDSIKLCFTNGEIIGDLSWDNCIITESITKDKKLKFPFIDLFIYESGYGTHICGQDGVISVNGESKKMFLPFSGPCNRCFRFIGKDKIVFFHNDWEKKDFFPTQRVNFLGIDCNIPKNPHKFLKNNFGEDYMTKKESPSWNHRTNQKNTNIIKEDYVRE